MKATFATVKPAESKVASNRKESNFLSSLILIAPQTDKADKFRPVAKEVAEVRIYGTQAKNYACIWIHAKGKYYSGGGNAGGYGYHRPSAAMESALANAGITLSDSISGVGESGMESALLAIGKALGYRKLQILRSHG